MQRYAFVKKVSGLGPIFGKMSLALYIWFARHPIPAAYFPFSS
jgi:hypothetical protein